MTGRRTWLHRRDRLAGLLIFLAAVAVLSWTWWSQHQDQQNAASLNQANRALTARTECLNKADQRLIQVINLRGQFADEDRAATTKLILSVQTARTAAQFQRDLNAYRAAENRITAERKAHPLPLLSEVCSGTPAP